MKALIPRRWKVGPRISYPFSEGKNVAGLSGALGNQIAKTNKSLESRFTWLITIMVALGFLIAVIK